MLLVSVCKCILLLQCVHTHGDTLVYFVLCTLGGQVVHSYGRLILNERAITEKQQLQPPNNTNGDGRIECRVSSGEAMFSYHGRTVTTDTSVDVHQIISGSTATVVIRDRVFNNYFINFEGNCSGIYHYLFLSNGEWCTCENRLYYVCGIRSGEIVPIDTTLGPGATE